MIEHYKPQFAHKDWIDNQDRVQAGGTNGINDRFHQLEKEFARLADMHLNPLIDGLGTTRFISLIPALTAYEVNGVTNSWTQGVDQVEKPTNVAAARGFMSISLPDNAHVTSLKVTGENKSERGVLTVALKGRQIANEDGGAVPLIETHEVGTATLPTADAKITNSTHRYFLTVEVVDAADVVVRVLCVQLTYQ
ncbi:hypothetical protein [Streptomyces sp. NPDC058667]|uniref:hypothetical protein n=1 Tax=Streptomyces sp. NPDC058667 TaxID=3346588 RepID=UPI00364B71A5